MPAALDDLPGFRRRIQITPAPGAVRAAVEDDYHHMVVTVRHADGVATSIEGAMPRAPWTTCPGAVVALQNTFTGIALKDFPARGVVKPSNCTHLFDLALWAAAHASDPSPTRYELLVADAIEDERKGELRRNGEIVLNWTLGADQRLVAPPQLAGRTLWELGDWIAGLPAEEQEAARIFRWGSMVANGRLYPMDVHGDISKMPAGVCFTFQPETAKHARRAQNIRDFSKGGTTPLADE